jgi:hypothetical protein
MRPPESNGMKDFEKYAKDNGFGLRLGRWDFGYTEGQKRLTIPVEMLSQGEFLWELSRSRIKAWDSPFDRECIDENTATKIVERIVHFVELTGKRVRVY